MKHVVLFCGLCWLVFGHQPANAQTFTGMRFGRVLDVSVVPNLKLDIGSSGDLSLLDSQPIYTGVLGFGVRVPVYDQSLQLQFGVFNTQGNFEGRTITGLGQGRLHLTGELASWQWLAGIFAWVDESGLDGWRQTASLRLGVTRTWENLLISQTFEWDRSDQIQPKRFELFRHAEQALAGLRSISQLGWQYQTWTVSGNYGLTVHENDFEPIEDAIELDVAKSWAFSVVAIKLHAYGRHTAFFSDRPANWLIGSGISASFDVVATWQELFPGSSQADDGGFDFEPF